MSQDLHATLARLEHENAILRDQIALIEHIDGALEEAILHKWPVARTMDAILEPARQRLHAQAILVRTFDEQQQRVDFASPATQRFEGLDLDALTEQIAQEGSLMRALEPGRWLLGYRLDVTDVYLGSVILIIHAAQEGDLEQGQPQRHMRGLHLWSEQVDNYLAAISDSRRKHQALQALSDALRSPILDEGLNRALRLLRHDVPYEDLALAICYEEHLERSAVNYRVIARQRWLSSTGGSSEALDRGLVLDFVRGQEAALIERVGLAPRRVSVPIFAADGVRAVGRVSVGLPEHQSLSPYAMDILDRFSDYIRLRVVDFNKEWKRLSHNFPQEVVRRLLQEERYFSRYLSPREREVAILFCDLSGFTRISEQVLREPALIGKLIDTWGNQVVELIWQEGGVFDKMVGDCIIGLWGPPFFELTSAQAAAQALRAACLIRDYTKTLKAHPELPQLAAMQGPVGVATGLNLCPLFVGTFGPDENYTGFSSGMNNTARLQSLASCDQILCMEPFARALAPGSPWAASLGQLRAAHVKNVAEPLRFYALEPEGSTLALGQG